jgi:hypothetical protein
MAVHHVNKKKRERDRQGNEIQMKKKEMWFAFCVLAPALEVAKMQIVGDVLPASILSPLFLFSLLGFWPVHKCASSESGQHAMPISLYGSRTPSLAKEQPEKKERKEEKEQVSRRPSSPILVPPPYSLRVPQGL